SYHHALLRRPRLQLSHSLRPARYLPLLRQGIALLHAGTLPTRATLSAGAGRGEWDKALYPLPALAGVCRRHGYRLCALVGVVWRLVLGAALLPLRVGSRRARAGRPAACPRHRAGGESADARRA